MFGTINQRFISYKLKKSQPLHQPFTNRHATQMETNQLYLDMVRFDQEVQKMISDVTHDLQTFGLTQQDQSMVAFDQIFPFLLAESPNKQFLQQVIRVHKVMKTLYDTKRIIFEEHYDRYQFLEFYLRAVMIHNGFIQSDKEILLKFYDKICATTNQEIRNHKLYHLIEQKVKLLYPNETQKILEKYNQKDTQIFKDIETLQQQKSLKLEKTEFEKIMEGTLHLKSGQSGQKSMIPHLQLSEAQILQRKVLKKKMPNLNMIKSVKNFQKKSKFAKSKKSNFVSSILGKRKKAVKKKKNDKISRRRVVKKIKKGSKKMMKKKGSTKKKKKAIKKKVLKKKKPPKKVKKICMFCNSQTHPPEGPISFKYKEIISFQTGEKRKTTYFYHKQCYFLNQGREILEFVNDKIKQCAFASKRRTCARCLQKRAFIPCQNPKCKKNYHMHCIEGLGKFHKCFKHLYKGRYDFYCHQHIDQRNEIDAAFEFAEKVCGFCQGDIHDEEIKQVMGNIIGPYEALQGKQYYVHTYCALWAPQVFKSGNQIMGVGKELKRSQKLFCSLCNQIGASHGCFKDDCGEKFHIKCLFDKQGLDPKSEKNIERFTENVYCKKHSGTIQTDGVEDDSSSDGVGEEDQQDPSSNNMKEKQSNEQQQQQKRLTSTTTIVGNHQIDENQARNSSSSTSSSKAEDDGDDDNDEEQEFVQSESSDLEEQQENMESG